MVGDYSLKVNTKFSSFGIRIGLGSIFFWLTWKWYYLEDKQIYDFFSFSLNIL
jgi:hypothetical protein